MIYIYETPVTSTRIVFAVTKVNRKDWRRWLPWARKESVVTGPLGKATEKLRRMFLSAVRDGTAKRVGPVLTQWTPVRLPISTGSWMLHDEVSVPETLEEAQRMSVTVALRQNGRITQLSSVSLLFLIQTAL